jgi:hypothetical protein
VLALERLICPTYSNAINFRTFHLGFEIQESMSISALNFDLKNKAEKMTFSSRSPKGKRNSKIAETPTLEFFDMYPLGKGWSKAARSGWARSKIKFFVQVKRDFARFWAILMESPGVVRRGRRAILVMCTLSCQDSADCSSGDLYLT